MKKNILRELRLEYRLSHSRAAEICGVSRSTFIRTEEDEIGRADLYEKYYGILQDYTSKIQINKSAINDLLVSAENSIHELSVLVKTIRHQVGPID